MSNAARAARLKRLRLRLKMTQRELADIIGYHANTVARWERGEARIINRVDARLREIAQIRATLEESDHATR
jgi:transcriptional regulator with XRE-family HTH domain